ncbi:MAG TPA: RHS repeat-associated core domain-containing protein [Verrucomicrobiae bacterium]|nr:RHS repeat-associated core domain-containing protein [Verrucomicrobiae bacterium]
MSRLTDQVLVGIGGTLRKCHYGFDAALSDSSGNIVEEYRYEAFGSPTIFDPSHSTLATFAFGNRFLFTGHEWDAATGLYHYRARAHSAEMGKFLQPDPIRFAASDRNAYRYALHSPTCFRDPLGLDDDGWDHIPCFGINRTAR